MFCSIHLSLFESGILVLHPTPTRNEAERETTSIMMGRGYSIQALLPRTIPTGHRPLANTAGHTSSRRATTINISRLRERHEATHHSYFTNHRQSVLRVTRHADTQTPHAEGIRQFSSNISVYYLRNRITTL